MSFGIAFSIQAGLGTSPISSLPYVVSRLTPFSVGAGTIALHCTLILLQNALLRRQGAQVDELVLGNTSLDLASATLRCRDSQLRLSAKEFDIMRCLLQAGTRNLSKEAILARVWGYDSDAVDNHVEVYVGFLRKKLASIGSNIRIETVRRLGYHLEVCGE